jgi:hypothetical protein
MNCHVAIKGICLSIWIRVFPIKVDLLERIRCLSTGSHAPRYRSSCIEVLLTGLLGAAVGHAGCIIRDPSGTLQNC